MKQAVNNSIQTNHRVHTLHTATTPPEIALQVVEEAVPTVSIKLLTAC